MEAIAGPSSPVGGADRADSNWSGTGCPSRECRAFIRAQSVLREHEILAEALNQSLGSLDLEELKQAASNDEAGLVRLAAPARKPAALGMLHAAGLGAGTAGGEIRRCHEGLLSGVEFLVRSGWASLRGTKAGCYFDSRHRRSSIQFSRRSGAGKTTTLREVQRGLNEAGHAIFAITPTASAAQCLRNEGFAQATTVEDFLRNGEKRGGLRNAVVICDEAGLKSNRQGAGLLQAGAKARHACPLGGRRAPACFCGSR